MPRRDDRLPHLTYEERITRLAIAQDHLCSLCHQPLDRRLIVSALDWGWSFEHVFPKARYPHLLGNLLVAHKGCNRRKGDRDPTGCEILLLLAINAKTGRELSFRDEVLEQIQLPVVYTPSQMAIALSQISR